MMKNAGGQLKRLPEQLRKRYQFPSTATDAFTYNRKQRSGNELGKLGRIYTQPSLKVLLSMALRIGHTKPKQFKAVPNL